MPQPSPASRRQEPRARNGAQGDLRVPPGAVTGTPRDRMRFLRAGIGALVLASLLAGCDTYLRYQGWAVTRQSPAAISALLAPQYRILRPAGQGPYPTAILLSGCDGPRDNLDRWAAMLTRAGWAAVIVDSHGPRGYDDAHIWRLICAGQLLTGGERAGDIAIAIDDLRRMPFVDADHIVLIGSSHGGWSILDLLSLHGAGRLPYNLTRWPDTIADRGLSGIAGMILLYPYCGPGSRAARTGWSADIPALFVLVEGDTIASEDACLKITRRMDARGKDVDVRLLTGTTHGFDQAEKNALSPLEFSPEATADAMQTARSFLDRLRTR